MRTIARKAIHSEARRTAVHCVVLRPRPDKSWLLAGTALAGGVLAAAMLTTRPAFATCDTSGATVHCYGDESANRVFSASSAGSPFLLTLGPPSGFVTNTPYHLNFTFGPPFNPAFQVNLNLVNGGANTIHLFQNSFIHNSEDGSGLKLNYSEDGNDVTLDIDQASAVGNSAGEIVGVTRGIEVTGGGSNNSVTVNNFGHVVGTNEDGIFVDGGLFATVNNHSYGSMIGGTSGANFDNVAQVVYDNSGGLTAGLSGSGLNVFDVSGAGLATTDFAVDVYNGHAGVFAGTDDGVRILDVNGNSATVAANVRVDNSGSATHAYVGGLIMSNGFAGVEVEGVTGAITINNNYTQQGSIDLTKLDPLAYNPSGGTGPFFNGVGHPELPPGFTTGIWGNQHGVFVSEGGESLGVSNVSGRIVGVNEEGIFAEDIAHDIEIDNHGVAGQAGGLVWGGKDGIGINEYGASVGGNVDINNNLGTIFGSGHGGLAVGISGAGLGNGIFADNVAGNVSTSNMGGLTFGYAADGIELVGIGGTSTIGNGGSHHKTGIILGAESGVRTVNDFMVDVQNFSQGAILGNGASFINPAIFLDTRGSEGGSASVYNAGLVSSYQLPTFGVSGNPIDPPNVPTVTLHYNKIFNDAHDIAQFAESAGSMGSIANLKLYGQAASLNAIASERGGVSVLNDTTGLLIGRLSLFGNTSNTVAEATNVTGNTVVNFGTWLTTDGTASPVGAALPLGNDLFGAGQNTAYNLGLIQTAFAGTGKETTTFLLNDLYNGGVPTSAKVTGGTGMISMIDGAPGDVTTILGNYHGASKPGFTALIGEDVKFGQGSQGAADLLQVEAFSATPIKPSPVIGGNVDGSTGIVVHKVNTLPSGINDTGIVLVSFAKDVNPASMKCNGPCKTGDTFYFSPLSNGYITINGIGAIADGNVAWYLTEVGDPTIVTKSTFNPVLAQSPALITGAQNIWYDASGVVEDHIYGNHFPTIGGGGGGADLPEGTGAASAPGEAAGNREGLWARMSGSWDSRSGSVTDSVFGTIDTGFNQSTFEVLGGGDFMPTGIGGPLHLGLFGGYTTSNLNFNDLGTSADYTGGVLGAYGAYTNGGYYADAQMTWNPLNLTFHESFGDVKTNANSLGVIANTGYRMDRGGYFLEPIASLDYVDTRLNNMGGGGATVDFSNGQSLRAGAGGRIGTDFPSVGGTTTEVSLLGKVWNEFESANKVTVSDGAGHTSSFTQNISGVFGEVMASATIFNAGRDMSGFVAGGAQFGNDFTNWEVKGGLRKTF